MSSRYAPFPTASQQDEMNAAFDDSDDEEHLHDDHPDQDRAPLLPHSQSTARSSPSHPLAGDEDSPTSALDTRRSLAMTAPAPPVPGTYDFEYDYPPPPGSPPPPATGFGNTNGYVPVEPVQTGPSRPNIFRRALGAILPTHYVRDERGGGLGNDGVFANMAAKPVGPSQAIREAASSGVNFAPEEVQKEAPPSYQSAQADAVPAYWETTIVTSTATGADGELIVDQLPTGSVFSFLWNLLVSMSFQFVGFLLTYLLHTTHAAKCGSRAGLGVTLIQYGFYLRQRMDYEGDQQDSLWGWPQDGTAAEPRPTFATADDARKYYEALADKNNTMALDPDTIASIQATASTANEWLSFFLMTVGWFVLLTSVLGFWRVKRWERGVRRAAHEAANPRPPPTAEELAQEQEIISQIEAAFGLVHTRVQNGADRIRTGLGLPPNWDQSPGEQAEATDQDRRRFEELTRRL